MKKTKTTKSKPLNRISVGTNLIFTYTFFFLLACFSILPLIFFIIMISISSNQSITDIGYSFIPAEFSMNAYQYLWDIKESIGKAFLVSVVVTVGGTAIGLLLNASMGYVLSRKNFRYRKLYTIMIFIPMVFFQGGMVSTYMINTQFFLMLKNTIWH